MAWLNALELVSFSKNKLFFPSYLLVPSGRKYKGKFRKSMGFGVRQIFVSSPGSSYLALVNYFILLTDKYLCARHCSACGRYRSEQDIELIF